MSRLRPNLRQFNNFLSVIVVLLAVFIIVMPFLPQLLWWLRHDAPVVSSAPSNSIQESVPAENTLVIPKIDLKLQILEGEHINTADKGLWRRPQSAVPSSVGNTVIVGHRFTYQGKSHFYHLDKLNIGDVIQVYWEGQSYRYKVASKAVVPPTETSVEAPADRRQLTLYTCTPLWSAKDRLVIQALPEEAQL
jgi:sortase A